MSFSYNEAMVASKKIVTQSPVKFTIEDVSRVAVLANLTLTQKQKEKLLPQILSVLDYMSKIQQADTKDVRETAQVTGLENVFREDTIEIERMFTQEEALANAPKSHNGFFVAEAIFNKD